VRAPASNAIVTSPAATLVHLPFRRAHMQLRQQQQYPVGIAVVEEQLQPVQDLLLSLTQT